MSLYEIALVVFLLAYGASVFIDERLVLVISGVAAIVAAVALLVQ